jgi:hypothetical protein
MTDLEKLYAGYSAKKVLMEYYASLHVASADLQYKIAMEMLAFAPIEFFKNIANKLKVKLSDIVNIFKDSRVVKFFSKIGWSLKKLYEMLKAGWRNVRILASAIEEYVSKTKVVRWTTEELKKLDAFLSKHPNAKAITGYGLGIALFFIFFLSANTGDAGYDFNFDDVMSAMSGNIGFADVFGGTGGIKLLTLFTIGTFTRISFPWLMADEMQLVIVVFLTLQKALKKRFQLTPELKHSNIISDVLTEAKWIRS